MPKVSVIIPCYNQGKYLDETVNSVLAQSYGNYEIVIVNDGSTDEFTNNLLREYRRPKTKVIHTENKGVSAARNTGISASSGAYILPLDGDDLIGMEYLQKAVAILDENRNIGIVTCLIEFFGAMEYRPVLPPFSVEAMLTRNDLPCSSLFRKDDWVRISGFNNNMTSGWEDWDFWLSLLELEVGVYRIPEVLFYYRILPGSRERTMTKEHRVQMYRQLFYNHPEFYSKNIGAVFRELCEYQDLLASRSYKYMNYCSNPMLLINKIIGKLPGFSIGKKRVN